MTIDTSKTFIILTMLFCHIVDDYYLQGILASMKQKQWWTKQEQYNSKYKNDYIIALIMHSFSWAFMTMLPIAVVSSFQIGVPFIIVFITNVIVHAFVDNLKANKMKINLVQDQFIHIMQIIVTAIEESLAENNIANCVVGTWDGLVADLMRSWNVKYLVRGLRNTMDYNYEENIAEVNKLIFPDIEYVYFRADNAAISSSMVKELHSYGQDVSNYVPNAILDVMKTEDLSDDKKHNNT